MIHSKVRKCLVSAVLVLLSLSAGAAHAQMSPTSRSILMNLSRNVDMKDFQNPMSLKEALQLIYEKLAHENVSLPILVDTEAFKAKNPNAPDVYDTPIKFPPFPRQMSAATALRVALSQVPEFDGTYLVRSGAIEVTTGEKASLRSLLQTRVQAVFEKKPLGDALDEVADATGISVVIDPRVQKNMKTPVTACFRGDVTTESALYLLADMAEVKAAILPSGVYLTTTDNAERLAKEQRRWLIRQPKVERQTATDRAPIGRQ